MSSVRNAVQRRNHKERSQPAARQKLGLLEKHKDYVLRAKDYHSKQNRLKAMKEKAYFKNPDEFYFGMINSQTKGGVHVVERNQKFSGDFLKLLKTQDIGYVAHQRNVGRKKIEKLKSEIHVLDDDEEEDAEADYMGLDGEMEYNLKDSVDSSKPKKQAKHTIFVDDEEEVKAFDPAKHFDTVPELVERKFNRPRKEQIEQAKGLAPPRKKVLKGMEKQREANYRELASRLAREEQLSKLEQEMAIQKNLMTKGRRQKVGVDSIGLPKYKWKADRKK